MKFGSLFTGIAGLDSGLEAAGMECAWQSEIDPFCCRYLHHVYPGVPNLGDIRLINWSLVPPVDVICGGFPCQPVSVAGKGKGTEDERWLWPEVVRALRGLGPRIAILENVPGLLSIGSGRVFGGILRDLVRLGYCVRWTCIRASHVGAPHRRKRLFILAHCKTERLQGLWSPGQFSAAASSAAAISRSNNHGLGNADSGRLAQPQGLDQGQRGRSEHTGKALGDSSGSGREEGDSGTGRAAGLGAANSGVQLLESRQNIALRLSGAWSAGVAVRGYDDTIRLIEPGIRPLVAGVKGRVPVLKALGNAVVPQVAEYLATLMLQQMEGDQQ